MTTALHEDTRNAATFYGGEWLRCPARVEGQAAACRGRLEWLVGPATRVRVRVAAIGQLEAGELHRECARCGSQLAVKVIEVALRTSAP